MQGHEWVKLPNFKTRVHCSLWWILCLKNFFLATTDNGAMLQVVFFAIIVGIALLQIPKEKGNPVIAFFDGFNDVIIQIVNYIMMIAPYGVFALMASLIVEIAGENPDSAVELLLALLKYSLVVTGGLLLMVMVVYPMILISFTKVKYLDFFQSDSTCTAIGIFDKFQFGYLTSHHEAGRGGDWCL